MGVERGEGAGLALQRFKAEDKRNVLEHIAMIADMEGVAIIQVDYRWSAEMAIAAEPILWALEIDFSSFNPGGEA